MSDNPFPLSRDELLNIYQTMRTIREFEERVHVEFSRGDIPGFVHLYAGEEASAAGIMAHLREDDRIASTHRGHGHCIAKGVDVKGMMAEIFGKKSGVCGGKGGSMHIADLDKGMMGANGILGAGAPLACGAALAAKYRDKGDIAICFVGDGASNQGTFLESLNLASIWNLPAVFVVETMVMPRLLQWIGQWLATVMWIVLPDLECRGSRWTALIFLPFMKLQEKSLDAPEKAVARHYWNAK